MGAAKESTREPILKVGGGLCSQGGRSVGCGNFRMPLHYPRYSKSDYESMPEWKLDCLLSQYGLPVAGSVEQKRKFAMGGCFSLATLEPIFANFEGNGV
ncbi:hypothetical protein RJ639_041855 [Escallonia herrerae]|uniref:DUF7722 domain-containing protein n=1 Tax=Escallonia herrerae TaxID=1293975 RepID=A0AA89B3I7_9ASTE|nr:hypothetical protein RJ639_041855 [Escallonia herrerae]